jgi:hypothetical protein
LDRPTKKPWRGQPWTDQPWRGQPYLGVLASPNLAKYGWPDQPKNLGEANLGETLTRRKRCVMLVHRWQW